jgi:hypothetical protein
MRKRVIGTSLLAMSLAAGCGGVVHPSATVDTTSSAVTISPNPTPTTTSSVGSAPVASAPIQVPLTTTPVPSSTTIVPSPTTTAPCSLSASGSGASVPIEQVCSSAGAPHFATPAEAMTYLASAWNNKDVQGLDYVTDPAGRGELDAMAGLMVNLRFKSCTANQAGDYTCYFQHDITPSSSATTYANPLGFPPGEAVFTVAPADGPGWYLTQVIHCG